jgi:hypothetical protein
MNIVFIQVEELTNIINNAIRDALPQVNREATPQPFIKGIHNLAKFLNVSPARAQKLKNEGALPYWQDGRTLLFDPDKVREVMSKGSGKKGKP